MKAIDRDIAKLAVPALGALLAEPLYILTDTAIVGHLGTDQLAGLAAASAVLLGIWTIFIFLAYGTTSAVGRMLGAGDERGAAGLAVQGLWLGLGIGVVLTIAGWVFGQPLLGALGAEGTVADEAWIYLRIGLFGVPSLLLVLAGTGYLRGALDTKTTLYVAVGTALFNLVFESILVYGMGYGIGASSVSTVVAQTIAAGFYVRTIRAAARRHGAPMRPDGASLTRLAAVSRDLFLRTIALRAAVVGSVAVAARIDATSLAAHHVAFEVWSFLAMGLDAVAIAAQAMVSRHLGAANIAAARAVGLRVMQWGVVTGVIAAAVIALARAPIAAVFSGDAEVVAATTTILLIVAVLQPINGIAFALDGVLIGASDMSYLAKAMVASLVVFLAAAIPVLVTGASLPWLWGALGLFMLARSATLGARFRGNAWAVEGSG